MPLGVLIIRIQYLGVYIGVPPAVGNCHLVPRRWQASIPVFLLQLPLLVAAVVVVVGVFVFCSVGNDSNSSQDAADQTDTSILSESC